MSATLPLNPNHIHESPALRLDAVSRRYAPSGGGSVIDALSDVRLDIARGSIVGVVGASGAGKTTLLNIAGRRVAPSSGHVHNGDGAVVLVPQDTDLRATRTILENVLSPQDGVGPDWDRNSLARDLLRELDLRDVEGRFPRELSAGERQKVAIARALVAQPDCLLLDEPFAVLDRRSAANVIALLDDQNGKHGTTILIASRNPTSLKDIANEIVVLDRGRIVEQGLTFELLTQPSSDITRDLVGAAFSASLPGFLASRVVSEPIQNGQAVVRLVFTGAAATTPVITRLARDLGLDANILLGAAETIRDRLYGVLIVGVTSGEPYLSAALDHFENAGLRADVIGFLGQD